MLSRSRWRLAIFTIATISVVAFFLVTAITHPACSPSRSCVVRNILIAALFLSLAAVVAIMVTGASASRSIQQLTHAARGITTGEFRYPIHAPARGEVGELARAFGVMSDRLSQRISGLEEERRQLRVMAEYMANGALIADEHGYVELINPEAARLLNIERGDSVGRTIAEVIRHHRLIELWRRCRASGSEQIEAIEIGGDLFVQVAITPFQQAETRGFLVSLQDLTQVRHLETVRRDFISNLSHELRTPLASLRAVVETLQAGAIDDRPAAERFLNRAEREVNTLTQMVQELLELSLIESGQVPLQLVPTPLNDLLLLPLERFQPLAERAGIELVLDLPVGLPRVLADAERLQQVVSNLLHNAIKFTPPGGRITVSAYEDTKLGGSGGAYPCVVITVKDTGIGISRVELTRVFERFYKSDRARTRGAGGIGLGLAIARHVVQAHDGEIWVNSREGRGSTFCFSLPAATSTGSTCE